MKHMILKFFGKKIILLFSFLIIPAIFIAIGNLNLVFLIYMSFTFSFAFVFDDFSFTVALPISRRDIVISNYLAYWILALLNTVYISSVLFFGMKLLDFSTDQSLSLLGILYSIDIIALFSLIIPFTLQGIIDPRIKRLAGLFVAAGYLFMFPFFYFFEFINRFNSVYQLIFTTFLVGILSYIGIKSSLKKIHQIDF